MKEKDTMYWFYKITRDWVLPGLVIASLGLIGAFHLKECAPQDNIIYIDSNEPEKQTRAQIYRWADAMGNGNYKISRLELETFLNQVTPYAPNRLVNKSISDWTDEEVDYVTKSYYEFCKDKGR